MIKQKDNIGEIGERETLERKTSHKIYPGDNIKGLFVKDERKPYDKQVTAMKKQVEKREPRFIESNYFLPFCLSTYE